MSLLVTIIVGAIAGWSAGQIMKGSGYGFLVNLVLGVIGSVVGSWLFTQFNINISLGNQYIDWIIQAAAGAVVVLFIAGLFKR